MTQVGGPLAGAALLDGRGRQVEGQLVHAADLKENDSTLIDISHKLFHSNSFMMLFRTICLILYLVF